MVWHELADRLPAPSLVAGYSLGELSAYGCAGALAAEDVVALASIRAREMDAAGPAGRLIAVVGLPVPQASAIAAAHGGHLAILIKEDHCVVGCPGSAAEELTSRLATQAREVVPLRVSVAAHTPLLDAAVDPFRRALRDRPSNVFRSPVLAGVNARQVRHRDDMVQRLPEQIHRTIRWDLVQARLLESPDRVFLELGNGTQLSRWLLAAGAGEARSVGEFRSVEGVIAWAEKAMSRASSR